MLLNAARESVTHADPRVRAQRYEELTREAHAVFLPLLRLSSEAESRDQATLLFLVAKNLLTEAAWARCPDRDAVKALAVGAALSPSVHAAASGFLARVALVEGVAVLDALGAHLEAHAPLVLSALVHFGKQLKSLILAVEMEQSPAGPLERVVEGLRARYQGWLQAILPFLGSPHQEAVLRVARMLLVHVHEYSPLGPEAVQAAGHVVSLVWPLMKTNARAAKLVCRICPEELRPSTFQLCEQLLAEYAVLDEGVMLAALDFVGNNLDDHSMPDLGAQRTTALAQIALDLLRIHGDELEEVEYLWLTVVRYSPLYALAQLQQSGPSLLALSLCPNELSVQYSYDRMFNEVLTPRAQAGTQELEGVAKCVEGWAYYMSEASVRPTMGLLAHIMSPSAPMGARIAACVAAHNVLNFAQVPVELPHEMAAQLAVAVAQATADALASQSVDQVRTLLLMDVVLNVLRRFPVNDLVANSLMGVYHRLLVEPEPLFHLHVLRNLLEHATPAYREFVLASLPTLESVSESPEQMEKLRRLLQ